MISHSCYSVCHYSNPVVNTKNQFCLGHQYLELKCSIEGYIVATQKGWKTCNNPSHHQVKAAYKSVSKAAFQLKARLQRTQVAHPDDAAEVIPHDDLFEAPNNNTGEAEEGSTKLRALFGRRRTHNEQIFVRPCGIIIARETFYGSETTPQVLVGFYYLLIYSRLLTVQFFFQAMLDHVFPTPESQPSFAIYDTGCGLYKHSASQGHTLHLRMALPVDPFHHKSKHKQSDIECQLHCNPAQFPELLRPDGAWVFNTSIAEQTNVWLGGYHSILREMTVDRYNFFLDELIMRKNDATKAKLDLEGQLPSYIPGLCFSSAQPIRILTILSFRFVTYPQQNYKPRPNISSLGT